jgi:hypothetical protein
LEPLGAEVASVGAAGVPVELEPAAEDPPVLLALPFIRTSALSIMLSRVYAAVFPVAGSPFEPVLVAVAALVAAAVAAFVALAVPVADFVGAEVAFGAVADAAPPPVPESGAVVSLRLSVETGVCSLLLFELPQAARNKLKITRADIKILNFFINP